MQVPLTFSSSTSSLPSLFPQPIICSALLSGRQGTRCYQLLSDRRISAPINHQSDHYICLCPVCVGGGAASGRFPVNTDLCDGSNDFIICDKARVEQEVSEGSLRCCLQTYRLYNPKTGSSSPLMGSAIE